MIALSTVGGIYLVHYAFFSKNAEALKEEKVVGKKQITGFESEWIPREHLQGQQGQAKRRR